MFAIIVNPVSGNRDHEALLRGVCKAVAAHGDSARVYETQCEGDGVRCTKQAIEDKCAPDCVEMEGAAVAHISAKNDLPCVILRAMSDYADEKGFEELVVKQFDVGEYCETAARVSAALIERL